MELKRLRGCVLGSVLVLSSQTALMCPVKAAAAAQSRPACFEVDLVLILCLLVASIFDCWCLDIRFCVVRHLECETKKQGWTLQQQQQQQQQQLPGEPPGRQRENVTPTG